MNTQTHLPYMRRSARRGLISSLVLTACGFVVPGTTGALLWYLGGFCSSLFLVAQVPRFSVLEFGEDALSIRTLFWTQRIVWADVQRFALIDFGDLSWFHRISRYRYAIGYLLQPQAIPAQLSRACRWSKGYGCHGLLLIPDGQEPFRFVELLRDRLAASVKP